MQTREPVRVGDALAPQTFDTSVTQVFRYSAATWNTHRIHYDQDYAAHEGYPGVLVQSHLHGAFLTKYCTDWAGDEGRLVDLSLRVRRFAVAGERLSVWATVRDIRSADQGFSLLDLDLMESRGSDGEVCVEGTATLEVPATWTAQGTAS
ncbi:MAG: MaoC family dehydratase N-terminal domain-containing protein [Acidimicrobiales bacterium]